MSASDAFHWRPYPVDGSSRCQAFANSEPPHADNYRPAEGAFPELVEYARLLAKHPIDVAAGILQQQSTPHEPAAVTSVSMRRHAAHADADVPTQSASASAVGLLERPTATEALDGPEGELDEPVDDDIRMPVEGSENDGDYYLDKKGRRVFYWFVADGSGFIAVDQNDVPFTDPDGHDIQVTRKGVAVADRASVGGLIRKGRNLIRSGGATTEALVDDIPEVFDENGAPIDHFPFPPAGKSPVISQRVWGGRRLQVVVAVSVVVAAIAAILGVYAGRSAVPAAGALSPEEVKAYRLSQLPVSAMAAFGQQYLQTCLTHNAYREQLPAREKLLASMATGGSAQDCGWTSGGKVQAPQMIVFTGKWEPLDGFAPGSAAVLSYSASMETGEFSTVTVPIWVSDPETSNDMSIVGDIGWEPGLQTKKPSQFKEPLTSDPRLAAELQGDVLQPFLKAWAGSDGRQIALIAAPDAKPVVRKGLGGALQNPKIQQASVYAKLTSGSAQNITYSDGDEVKAVVTVDWDVKSSESTQTTGYRINLRRDSGKWLVINIRGGAVNEQSAQSNPAQGDSGINRVDAGLAETGGAADEQSTSPSTSPSSSEMPTP